MKINCRRSLFGAGLTQHATFTRVVASGYVFFSRFIIITICYYFLARRPFNPPTGWPFDNNNNKKKIFPNPNHETFDDGRFTGGVWRTWRDGEQLRRLPSGRSTSGTEENKGLIEAQNKRPEAVFFGLPESSENKGIFSDLPSIPLADGREETRSGSKTNIAGKTVSFDAFPGDVFVSYWRAK